MMMESGISTVMLACFLLVSTQNVMSLVTTTSRHNLMLHQRQLGEIGTGNMKRTQLHLHPKYKRSFLPECSVTPTTLFSSSAVTAPSIDVMHEKSKSTLERIRTSLYNFSRTKTFRFLKVVMIMLGSLAIVCNFNRLAAHASEIASEMMEGVAQGGEAVQEVTEVVVAAPVAKSKSRTLKRVSKYFRRAGRLLKNLLDGANMKGSSRTWKAGDTRTELGMILNVFSTLVMWGLVGGAATMVAAMRDAKFERNRKKELNKVQEYKENMYFEAVQDILKKLADPKLKGSAKANLTRQLKDIDPDGVIQKFVTEGGERPDLTGMMGQKKNKKKKRKTYGMEKERPPPKKKDPQSKKTDKNKLSNDDEEGRDNKKRKSKKSSDDNSIGESSTMSYSYSSYSVSYFSSKESSSSDESTLKLLNALYSSLDGVMPDSKRQNVCEYVLKRLNAISNEEKRDVAAVKISQKLGDSAYWLNFVEQYEL